ncbi:type IV toxin-antitoxin system AbiEi family antitoxin [Paraburkholderia elongata]|uniref:type IV toxin-antitoxin system AbiEi family antitoxin n=1 Tax=Paraburkholderia elongata TaxID=2675747 RepID=UPI002E2BBCE7|nr:type IV toxin-antitoxin system AbiEi family antitoxin [Paraburkholderia elongata]
MLSITDYQILANACNAFANSTRVFSAAPTAAQDFSSTMVDAAIEFDVAGKKFTMPVHLEERVTLPGVLLAPQRLYSTELEGRDQRRLMLVAPFIEPDLASHLVELEQPFLDTAGNVYLSEPEATILIAGRPKPQTIKSKPTTRATTRKGLQVMFALATQPGLANQPYRTIADVSGVALSTVNQVVDDLIYRGLLATRRNGDRTIPDWSKYVQEWASLYPSRLRAKLSSRRFASTSRDWWKTFDFTQFDARLGGEAAAEILTHDLLSAHVTIYSQIAPEHEFMFKARLRPDPSGDVEIVQAFWPERLSQGWLPDASLPLVHPLLIYADLVASGDSRNLDTAQVINEQYLSKIAP